MGEKGCPAGCLHQRRVNAFEAGLTPLWAQAAQLLENDQLLLCESCGCVRRRFFDAYLHRHRTIDLGTLDAGRQEFAPSLWLRTEMERGAKQAADERLR